MINFSFKEEKPKTLSVQNEPVKRLSMPQQVIIRPDEYTGDYTVTPGDSVQILETENKYMTGNITVGAIPNNYGLITWNGATLTVS